MKNEKLKKAKKLLLKALIWTSSVLTGLTILLIVLLQLPSVQLKLTSTAVSFLEKKIQSRVTLGGINVAFPKSVLLEDFYVEDLQKDTLIYFHSLKVDVDMFALLRNEIQLNHVDFDALVAKVHKDAEYSAYNFDFILTAFEDTTKVEKTEKKPWTFSLEELNIEQSQLHYLDAVDGMSAHLDVGNFSVEVDHFALDTFNIQFDEIILENTKGVLSLTKSSRQETEEPHSIQNSLPNISFNEIALNNVAFTLIDQANKQKADINIGEAFFDAKEIDPEKQLINLKELKIHNTLLNYVKQANTENNQADTIKLSSLTTNPGQILSKFGWDIKVKQIDFAGLDLNYQTGILDTTKKGLNTKNIHVSDFKANIRDLSLDTDAFETNIKNISFIEHSGLDLQQFAGAFKLNHTSFSVSDMQIRTAYSAINAELSAEFRSLTNLIEKLKEVKVKAQISESKISLSDISNFVPGIVDSLNLPISDTASVRMNIAINGTVADMEISQFIIQALNTTSLDIRGHVVGLPEYKNLNLDLLAGLQTSKADLELLMSAEENKNSIQFPANIDLQLSAKGDTENLTADLEAKSSYGNINADLDLSDIFSDLPGYKGQISMDNFALGALLGDSSKIGPITVSIDAEGTGLSIDSADAEFDILLDNFQYLYYDYKDLALSGSIRNEQLHIASSLDDENLSFELEGDVDLDKEDKAYKLKLDLQKAYLRELHLSETDFRIQTKVDADLTYGSFKNINGDLSIRDLSTYKNKELYRVDSFLVASLNEEKNTALSIKSDILTADFKGTLSVFDIGKTLKQHFNTYYNIDSVGQEITAEQDFDFEIDIKSSDLITDVLVPQLGKFQPVEIKGSYDSKEKNLELRLDIPVLNYAGFEIDSLVFFADSDMEKLTYGLSISQARDSLFNITKLKIAGEAADNKISSQLQILDTASTVKYNFGGALQQENEATVFRFTTDDLIFNYENWQLPKDHFLQFGKGGFRTNDFILTNGSQKLALNSGDQKLNVQFTQFDLEMLSGLIESKKRILRGIIEGNVSLDNREDFTALVADLSIEKVQYKEDTIGNIDLLIKHENPTRYDVNVGISGSGNEVEIAGHYINDTLNSEISADADIRKLQLATIEVLAGNSINNAGGHITGSTNISGTQDQPKITGKLRFEDAEFQVDYLGTKVKIDNQHIDIAQDKVTLNDFEIRDENENSITIGGNVDIKNLNNPVFDLAIKAKDFLALNTTAEDNDMYYGKLYLNTNSTFKGSMNEPEISIKIDVGAESKLTYVVPKADQEIAEREGVIRFVDKDAIEVEFLAGIKNAVKGDTLKAPLGLDVNAVISVDKESEFEIVIDPVAGDKLQIKGTADLILAINQAGDISLTGPYEVSEGKYLFTFYNVVKKEFDLEKGSRLTWLGDVMNAEAKLTALYKTEASPIDLMQSVVSENTESGIYKQKLPFIVYLKMEGELLNPDISFELGMGDGAKSYAGGAVFGKIQSINQTESEVNKQVFSLLLLNRFMADNPFASAGGGSTEGMIRSSVSKILSEQLSRLTDKIEGINIDLGLKSYEDYSSGEGQGRTDLNLGLSSNFFDDRVTVKVAGNINLEGAHEQQKDLADFAGDVSLEYKLSEDGSFRLITFRKEVYEALLQGQVIETGGGFIVIKDFDKFNEIFKLKSKPEDE